MYFYQDAEYICTLYSILLKPTVQIDSFSPVVVVHLYWHCACNTCTHGCTPTVYMYHFHDSYCTDQR